MSSINSFVRTEAVASDFKEAGVTQPRSCSSITRLVANVLHRGYHVKSGMDAAEFVAFVPHSPRIIKK